MTLILNGTDGLSDVDGTAATPAIRGTDANTGIFFPAADTIAFSEGGTEAMRITPNGDVGIGTTSPTIRAAGEIALEIQGTTGRGNLQLNTSAADATGVTAGSVAFYGGASSSGGEPRISLISATTDGATANNRGGLLGFATKSNNGGLTERMRVTSDGNLLVGTTSNTANAGMNLSIPDLTTKNGFNITNASANTGGSYITFRNSAGNLAGVITQSGSTTVSYTTSSDYRLKENIAPMIGALAKVSQLKPCTYTWKIDGSAGQGFIAHELQAVVPDCVTGEKDAVETYTDEDGNEQTRIRPQGIDTSFLVATLTAAIQELKAELDSVKVELATLKAQP
jgi:hypothetical protein